MHDLELRAEVGVLVLQCVEAVWASGDDRLHPALLLVSVECRGVRLGEHREQKLIAGAAGRVAGTSFFLAEDREVDVRLFEESSGRARDLLRAIVVAGGAANPVENLGRGLVGEERNVETVGPCRAIHAGKVPGIAIRFHRLEWLLEGVRELVFDHHEVPPHVDDLVDVGDQDGALLLASAA